MDITKNQLKALRDFICDLNIDDEWFLCHTDIRFNDRTYTVVLENMM